MPGCCVVDLVTLLRIVSLAVNAHTAMQDQITQINHFRLLTITASRITNSAVHLTFIPSASR